MKNYRVHKWDYTDREWYNLIYVQEGLPEYVDLFDEYGEVSADYALLFEEGTSYDLLHKNLCITDNEALLTFLLEDAGTTNSMDEAIKTNLWDYESFKLRGDTEGLCLILDICYDVEGYKFTDSRQFLFEDYLEN
jgi:hypothetical protein